MENHPFIVVHDYGMGAVHGVVDAPSKELVQEALGPGWVVYEPGEAGAPTQTIDDFDLRSPLDPPQQWLKDQLYISARQSEGKVPYSFKSNQGGLLEYWTVWARSAQEVVILYPWLAPFYGEAMDEVMMKLRKTCDIDCAADFLKV